MAYESLASVNCDPLILASRSSGVSKLRRPYISLTIGSRVLKFYPFSWIIILKRSLSHLLFLLRFEPCFVVTLLPFLHNTQWEINIMVAALFVVDACVQTIVCTTSLRKIQTGLCELWQLSYFRNVTIYLFIWDLM